MLNSDFQIDPHCLLTSARYPRLSTFYEKDQTKTINVRSEELDESNTTTQSNQTWRFIGQSSTVQKMARNLDAEEMDSLK